jgi:hypothetical protein
MLSRELLLYCYKDTHRYYRYQFLVANIYEVRVIPKPLWASSQNFVPFKISGYDVPTGMALNTLIILTNSGYWPKLY